MVSRNSLPRSLHRLKLDTTYKKKGRSRRNRLVLHSVFFFANRNLSVCSSITNSVSPTSSIRTHRIICRRSGQYAHHQKSLTHAAVGASSAILESSAIPRGKKPRNTVIATARRDSPTACAWTRPEKSASNSCSVPGAALAPWSNVMRAFSSRVRSSSLEKRAPSSCWVGSEEL